MHGTSLLIAAPRLSSFRDGQTGLGEVGLNQVWPSSKAGNGEVELLVQLFEVVAHQVAHLDILEMVPAALVPRVEIGGIGRQRLQPDSAISARDELLDRDPAVNRRAVPDDQQSSTRSPEQVLK